MMGLECLQAANAVLPTSNSLLAANAVLPSANSVLAANAATGSGFQQLLQSAQNDASAGAAVDAAAPALDATALAVATKDVLPAPLCSAADIALAGQSEQPPSAPAHEDAGTPVAATTRTAAKSAAVGARKEKSTAVEFRASTSAGSATVPDTVPVVVPTAAEPLSVAVVAEPDVSGKQLESDTTERVSTTAFSNHVRSKAAPLTAAPQRADSSPAIAAKPVPLNARMTPTQVTAAVVTQSPSVASASQLGAPATAAQPASAPTVAAPPIPAPNVVAPTPQDIPAAAEVTSLSPVQRGASAITTAITDAPPVPVATTNAEAPLTQPVAEAALPALSAVQLTTASPSVTAKSATAPSPVSSPATSVAQDDVVHPEVAPPAVPAASIVPNTPAALSATAVPQTTAAAQSRTAATPRAAGAQRLQPIKPVSGAPVGTHTPPTSISEPSAPTQPLLAHSLVARPVAAPLPAAEAAPVARGGSVLREDIAAPSGNGGKADSLSQESAPKGKDVKRESAPVHAAEAAAVTTAAQPVSTSASNTAASTAPAPQPATPAAAVMPVVSGTNPPAAPIEHNPGKPLTAAPAPTPATEPVVQSGHLRVNSASSELKVSVQLPALGRVEVRAVSNPQGTTAHVTAARHEVVQALASERGNLEQALRARDVQLGSLGAQTQERSASQRESPPLPLRYSRDKEATEKHSTAAEVVAVAPEHASISVLA